MVSSRRWSLWSVVAVVGVLAGGAACNNTVSQGSGTEATASTSQAAEQGATPDAKTPAAAQPGADAKPCDDKGDKGRPDGPRGSGHRGPPGPDSLLKTALRELTLTDAQKTTIQGALDKLAPGPKDHKMGDKSPFAALAAGVRAGRIDAAAITPKLASSALDERAQASAAALQTLHDTLTKEQRRALVDSTLKRVQEHGVGAEHSRGERPAGDHPRGDRGPGARGGGGSVEHLLADLNLTAAQRTSIDAALAANKPAPVDQEAMKKRVEAMQTEMRARLESFAADSFDAKAFVKRPDVNDMPGPKDHMDRMAKDLSAIVAVLDAAQREKLATQLEKGPMMGHPGEREPAEAPGQ